jgi:uncharacterized protein (UPF0333 family)
MQRSQAALEYLLAVGVLMLFLLPVWLYITSGLNTNACNVRIAQAETAVNKLKEAADSVYVQGYPARIPVMITLPEGVMNSSVSGRSIELKVEAPGTVTDVFAITMANLTGSIPSSQGNHRVAVAAQKDGTVSLGESG